jgi:polyribonucleotide nucleotidyltransferase
MHHYYMPPYSVGEAKRFGWPSRREIGHGALAERALLAVIPSEEVFPYTIRVVSEILSSNGSTSMASVCGSTLSLMDAGVPIKEPVAGIALGLVVEGKNHVVLSDIQGVEDFTGDMDFKVAGTQHGVTAIQLDVKIDGLSDALLKEAINQAREGRMHILSIMNSILPTVRPSVSQFAPKVQQIKIPTEKIGEVIGPGGKIIRTIISETQTTVDVNDDGTVTVSSADGQMVEKAIAWIESLIRGVKAGEEFDGVVKRILPFGAFVEIIPGKEGLVHVSQMSTDYVKDPNDVVQIGQKVKVRVAEIDAQGRINLSMLFGEDAKEKPRREFSGGHRGGFDRKGHNPRRRFSS